MASVYTTEIIPVNAGLVEYLNSLARGKGNLVRIYTQRKQTPETALKKAAVQLLKLHKIITWQYPGAINGARGFPDRVGILPGGRFLAIEFKRLAGISETTGKKIPQGELTDFQKAVKQQIEAAGGKYIVCRCLDDLTDGLGLGGRLF